jgi:hypothetical protein
MISRDVNDGIHFHRAASDFYGRFIDDCLGIASCSPNDLLY